MRVDSMAGAAGANAAAGSGPRSKAGLKPNLAAVYSARQQRSANHSRQSSPGGIGSNFLHPVLPHLCAQDGSPTSPCEGFAGRLTPRGRSAPTSPTGAAADRRGRGPEQDLGDSADVCVEEVFTPVPPQSLPPNRSGGNVHAQRRLIALSGVAETRWALGQVEHSLSAQAWEFSPRSRSLSADSPASPSHAPGGPVHACRGESMSPAAALTHSPMSPRRHLAVSSGARACPVLSRSGYLEASPDVPTDDRGPCSSPRVFGNSTPASDTFNPDGMLAQSLHMQLSARVAPKSVVHRPEQRAPLGEAQFVPAAEDELRVGEVGMGLSGPHSRENRQLSLCQNVVLCCPAKLPTKDVFAQQKVPRPVSLEGSPRLPGSDASGNCLASPASLASLGSPRFLAEGRGLLSDSPRAGQRFQAVLEEARTPDVDEGMKDARLQILMSERRLSASSMATVLPEWRGDDPNWNGCLDDRLWEVKRELVRGLAAASSRRRSAPELVSGDYPELQGTRGDLANCSSEYFEEGCHEVSSDELRRIRRA